MKSAKRNQPSLKGLRSAKRRTINTAPDTLIKTRTLQPQQPLPFVVEPAVEGVDLLSWAKANRAYIEEKLLEAGGILFRGFPVTSPEIFEEFISTVSDSLMEYRERSSPRSHVSGNIFTSTDYPADQRIFLHNENSYSYVWPRKIFFYCHTPPDTGGETPIADSRKVLARLQSELQERFREKGVMYVRNLNDSLGLNWPTVFQTSDKAEVEEFCRNAGYEFEWQANGGLRTRRRAQAIVTHPASGADLWFNHATFFHISTMEAATQESLLALFDESELPNNTYYGDGSPIEAETMEALRQAYREETVAFAWQQGDILMLDNMAVAHGREAFTGPRKILTGLAEPFRYEDLK